MSEEHGRDDHIVDNQLYDNTNITNEYEDPPSYYTELLPPDQSTRPTATSSHSTQVRNLDFGTANSKSFLINYWDPNNLEQSTPIFSNTQQFVQEITPSTSSGETLSQTSNLVSRIESPVSKATPSTSYSQPLFQSQKPVPLVRSAQVLPNTQLVQKVTPSTSSGKTSSQTSDFVSRIELPVSKATPSTSYSQSSVQSQKPVPLVLSAQVLSNTQQLVQKVTLSTSSGETSSQTSDFVSRIASPVLKATPSTSYNQSSFPSQSFVPIVRQIVADAIPSTSSAGTSSQISPAQRIEQNIREVIQTTGNGGTYPQTNRIVNQGNAASAQFKPIFGASIFEIETSILSPSIVIPLDRPNTESETEGSTSLDEKLIFLEKEIEPWSTVEKNWRETHERREKYLETITSIDEYFSRFSCLKQPLGVNLLTLDFDLKYPEKANCMQTSWPLLRDGLKHLLLVTRRPKNGAFESELMQLADPLTQEYIVDTLLLWLLPALFKTTTTVVRIEEEESTSTGTGKKKSKKRKLLPTNAEIQEGVLFHVETANDIQESIGRVRRFMKTNKKHLQPRPVVVGPINKIESSYISIGGQLLPVLNPVHAVESILKIYYALNIEYPPEAVTVWKLLASAIYDFKPQPPASSATPSLISELNVVAHKIRHGNSSS